MIDGFFDAGMLRQALKSGERDEKELKKSEKEVAALRRNVGKKLRLTEY